MAVTHFSVPIWQEIVIQSSSIKQPIRLGGTKSVGSSCHRASSYRISDQYPNYKQIIGSLSGVFGLIRLARKLTPDCTPHASRRATVMLIPQRQSRACTCLPTDLIGCSEAAEAKDVGVGIALSNRAEGCLLEWIPVDHLWQSGNALEAGIESSMIVSLKKLKTKDEKGQPCLPLDIANPSG
ncbi:hypothetical protein T265_02487 [Opisthorchis viverrini]|uniref:Uncharacterized protein n=1 Tax=Opisthorchis viverrini TaxID=6198 RepID=A0A075A6N1_OPIVI|nr:hypothetical protein T265_02487 [Opisthorchis viverrini]KER31305.1 hypothetical protein T265_02487 [Opisthorchis viverrini]